MSEVYEYRLAYAGRGWETFPADSDGKKKSHKSAKHSNGANWGKTLDPVQIGLDFKKWPKANVGIVTGAKSGIFVVEADTADGHGKDGVAALKALEAKHGKLPETLMSESPTGSQHYYFNWPQGVTIKNSSSKIATGVDIRGEGGMVIGVPSITAKGVYRWLNPGAPIADAPPWLLDMITSDKTEREPPREDAPPSPELMEKLKQHAGKGIEVEPVDMEELRAALFAVDPDNYDNWFACLAALKNDLGEDGRALALEWTEAGIGPDWQGRRLSRFSVKWGKDLEGVTGIHLGSIFHLAGSGWRSPTGRHGRPKWRRQR